MIIYLIYYFSQKEVRCVHCNSICKPLTYNQSSGHLEYQTPAHQQYVPSSSQSSYDESYEQQEVEVLGGAPKYCPFCGSELDKRQQKFCANCGNNLQ